MKEKVVELGCDGEAWLVKQNKENKSLNNAQILITEYLHDLFKNDIVTFKEIATYVFLESCTTWGNWGFIKNRNGEDQLVLFSSKEPMERFGWGWYIGPKPFASVL